MRLMLYINIYSGEIHFLKILKIFLSGYMGKLYQKIYKNL